MMAFSPILCGLNCRVDVLYIRGDSIIIFGDCLFAEETTTSARTHTKRYGDRLLEHLSLFLPMAVLLGPSTLCTASSVCLCPSLFVGVCCYCFVCRTQRARNYSSAVPFQDFCEISSFHRVVQNRSRWNIFINICCRYIKLYQY